MILPAPVTTGTTAIITFDQMMPAMMSTWSLLEHVVGDLHADVGLGLVVAVDHLDRQPADLAAEVLERELDRVLHVLADDRPAGRSSW